MARLSDIIEDFIKEMFNNNDDNIVFIQRNELADQFRCAPSQINYVLTTRFTYERGYLIESKRGGGGHIVIKQLSHLLESDIIEEKQYELMKIAINDRSLISVENKNKVRADILKAMIMVILS